MKTTTGNMKGEPVITIVLTTSSWSLLHDAMAPWLVVDLIGRASILLTDRNWESFRQFSGYRSGLDLCRERMWSQKRRNSVETNVKSKSNKKWDEWSVSFLTVRWDEGKMKFWLLRWSKIVLEKKRKKNQVERMPTFVFDDELRSAVIWMLNKWLDGSSEQKRKELFVSTYLAEPSRAWSCELQARLGSNVLPYVRSGIRVALDVTYMGMPWM